MKYKCKKCGREFHFKETYDQHVNRCTEEPEPKIEEKKKKKFRCHRCRKKFTLKWIYLKHLEEKKCTVRVKKNDKIKKSDVEGWT